MYTYASGHSAVCGGASRERVMNHVNRRYNNWSSAAQG